MARGPNKIKTEKKVTRYTYDDIKEPRTPETGHTSLLPADEQVVTLPMDNGWSAAIEVGKLPTKDLRPVVVDMDPAVDPVLFWSGKRNRREVPVLPLQRNEIVSESRISQIIERIRRAVDETSDIARQGHLFADIEKALRESNRSKRVAFYTHDEGWKNKLICGDSLHVMESLLHYENMRGKVQTVYIDPPYGIKYDSNFQQRVDSTKNDEKDTADDILTIKAFRDTWTLGIHSYLSYLSERLYIVRELLSERGSIFVQIGEDNEHLVRSLLDEVMGSRNFVSHIVFRKTSGKGGASIDAVYDSLLWYAKNKDSMTYNQLYAERADYTLDQQYAWIELSDGTCRRLTNQELEGEIDPPKGRRFKADGLYSESGGRTTSFDFALEGKTYSLPPHWFWKTNLEGMSKLASIRRLIGVGRTLCYKRYADDFPFVRRNNLWDDTMASGYGAGRFYVVQTSPKVIERCVAMTTDPGDIVFDPTCGGGTSAVAAERLGRRWITCDTSRVAVNVARERLLSLTYPHFVLKGAALRDGFVNKSWKRVTLGSLTKGLEAETIEFIDVPDTDENAIRITGPFEIASLGRYSLEDWKGYVVSGPAFGDAAKLENYIEVICRLYRRNAAIQGATGLIHAVAETEKEKIAISVGPLSGRVTGKQINDAVQDALASGILEVHVLGWAFEANVGEVKSQLEKRGKVKVELIMIRPDTLAEGLKATKPEMLFSPLALPDIEVAIEKKGKEKQVRVTLNGVALFDRKHRTTEYKTADSGYVSAWYLDEDYDGDCFVDCQMFFDFKKVPNIKAAVRADVDPEAFTLSLASEPFPVRGYKRIAVKVVDVYGNESTIVRDMV